MQLSDIFLYTTNVLMKPTNWLAKRWHWLQTKLIISRAELLGRG